MWVGGEGGMSSTPLADPPTAPQPALVSGQQYQRDSNSTKHWWRYWEGVWVPAPSPLPAQTHYDTPLPKWTNPGRLRSIRAQIEG